MKMKTLLAAAAMFFGLSTAAFASVTFGVGSTPVTKIVATGHTEASGSITFTATADGSVVNQSTINIQMPTVQISGVATPLPITFPALPPANPALILGGTRAGTAVVSISATSNNALGTLVLSVAPGTMVAGDTIVVFGLRISPASTPGLVPPVKAQISATQDIALSVGQTDPIIVQDISDALKDVNVKGSPASVTFKATDKKGTSGDGLITVQENFAAAFQSASQVGSGSTTSTNVRLTLSEIPPGLEVTFKGTVPAGTAGLGPLVGLTRTDSKGAAAGTDITFDSSDASPTVYYSINGSVDAGVIDVMKIPFTATTSIAPPLTGGRVTVAASFAPIGTAFDTDGITVLTTPLPRYAAKDVDGGQIITVGSNNTALLFTHVLNILDFNSGFAIANTTTDPDGAFGTPATRQAGAITFNFYPAASGNAISYRTKAGSPGSGLDGSGQVPSGRTYLVLLSELLAAAGAPADFQGYVIVVTEFSNAHAISFVLDAGHIVQAQAALVMQDSRDPVESLNN